MMTREQMFKAIAIFYPCNNGLIRLKHTKGTVRQMLRIYSAASEWQSPTSNHVQKADLDWLKAKIRFGLLLGPTCFYKRYRKAAKSLAVEFQAAGIKL